MKQSAVEFIFKQITLFGDENGGVYFTPYMKKEIIEQANKMFEEQIISAFDDGWIRANDTKDFAHSTAEDFGDNYYNKTYKSE